LGETSLFLFLFFLGEETLLINPIYKLKETYISLRVGEISRLI